MSGTSSVPITSLLTVPPGVSIWPLPPGVSLFTVAPQLTLCGFNIWILHFIEQAQSADTCSLADPSNPFLTTVSFTPPPKTLVVTASQGSPDLVTITVAGPSGPTLVASIAPTLSSAAISPLATAPSTTGIPPSSPPQDANSTAKNIEIGVGISAAVFLLALGALFIYRSRRKRQDAAKSRERLVDHGPAEDTAYAGPVIQSEPAEMAEYNPDVPELSQNYKSPAKYFGHTPRMYEMSANVESGRLLSELPVSRQ